MDISYRDISFSAQIQLDQYCMEQCLSSPSLTTSLHALPLGSLDWACPQAEPTSQSGRVAQNTFIHAPSMGAANH